jgi:PAS domain S-box-containing protein
MAATDSVPETEQLAAECEALRRRIAELEAERLAYLAQLPPEQQQQLDALAAAEARADLRVRDAALAAALTGIAISDLEGTLVYVNPAFARMHGCSVSELVGKKVTSLWPAEASEALEAVKTQGSWSGERQVQRKDGSPLVVRIEVTAFCDANGLPIGAVGAFADVTERTRV